MSEIIRPGFNIDSACNFNYDFSQDIGIPQILPESVVDAFPGLKADPRGSRSQRETFAKGTLELQKALFPDELDHDGKFGRGTLKAVLKKYAPIASNSRHILHYGRRLACPVRENSSVLYTYEDPMGLNMHESVKRSRKDRPIKKIVIHWSATLSAKSCYRILMNRRLSSHFGVGLENGVGTIYQWFDTKWEAQHAGAGNPYSIGIDICSTPVIDYESRLKKLGHEIKVIDNPTDRGDKRVLTLDPRIADATAELLYDLSAIFNIPKIVPGNAGKIEHKTLEKHVMLDWRGILGHHHVSSRKWDIACWEHDIITRLNALT